MIQFSIRTRNRYEGIVHGGDRVYLVRQSRSSGLDPREQIIVLDSLSVGDGILHRGRFRFPNDFARYTASKTSPYITVGSRRYWFDNNDPDLWITQPGLREADDTSEVNRCNRLTSLPNEHRCRIVDGIGFGFVDGKPVWVCLHAQGWGHEPMPVDGWIGTAGGMNYAVSSIGGPPQTEVIVGRQDFTSFIRSVSVVVGHTVLARGLPNEALMTIQLLKGDKVGLVFYPREFQPFDHRDKTEILPLDGVSTEGHWNSTDFVVSPCGERLAVATPTAPNPKKQFNRKTILQLFNIDRGGRTAYKIAEYDFPCEHVAFSPDGMTLAMLGSTGGLAVAGSHDRTLTIIDME